MPTIWFILYNLSNGEYPNAYTGAWLDKFYIEEKNEWPMKMELFVENIFVQHILLLN